MKPINQLLSAAALAILLSACATPSGFNVDPDAKASPTALGQGHNNAVAEVKSPNPFLVDAAIGSGSTVAGSSSSKTPPADPQVKAEQLLTEGIELYDKGDYKGAIRKLMLARDAAANPSITQQSSLKYLAFSYCITGQKPLCRAQFASLLLAAPDFQLGRGEAGHPLWGPVFKDATKDAKNEKSGIVNVTAKNKKLK